MTKIFMCVGLSFFGYTLLTMFDLGPYPSRHALEIEFSNGLEYIRQNVFEHKMSNCFVPPIFDAYLKKFRLAGN